jgi:flavorubredoxin
MKPFEITSDVYWIGALHPDLRIFDIIMKTANGTTYNSYLIRDQKTAVIDTVKSKFSQQYFQNISEIIDPAEISYVIIQHNEPDHSGSLKELLSRAPQAKVLCAKPAIKYVKNIVNKDIDIEAVNEDTEINLGSKALRFLSTPFLHWPDTMMTRLDEHILFPCDVFASHYCDSHMFDDRITENFWPDFTYYFNMILRPFKKHLRKALDKIDQHQIELIAPSHGPILRQNIQKYFDAYAEWSKELPPNDPKKVLIYYASAHGNTEKMANMIFKGVNTAGVEASLYNVMEINLQNQLNLIEQCDGLIVGSPTINNDAVKPIWDLLSVLTTLDIKGKKAASFGSIGWSGEAVKFLDERLRSLKFKVPYDGITATLVPDESDLSSCEQFGKDFANNL